MKKTVFLFLFYLLISSDIYSQYIHGFFNSSDSTVTIQWGRLTFDTDTSQFKFFIVGRKPKDNNSHTFSIVDTIQFNSIRTDTLEIIKIYTDSLITVDDISYTYDTFGNHFMTIGDSTFAVPDCWILDLTRREDDERNNYQNFIICFPGYYIYVDNELKYQSYFGEEITYRIVNVRKGNDNNSSNPYQELTINTITNLNSESNNLIFRLNNNYPNPFNPTTTIEYTVDKETIVNLVIYDILGNKIETIVNETQKPNSYSVKWNGQNYSSGIYFYTIKTDLNFQSKKMLLIK